MVHGKTQKEIRNKKIPLLILITFEYLLGFFGFFSIETPSLYESDKIEYFIKVYQKQWSDLCTLVAISHLLATTVFFFSLLFTLSRFKHA